MPLAVSLHSHTITNSILKKKLSVPSKVYAEAGQAKMTETNESTQGIITATIGTIMFQRSNKRSDSKEKQLIAWPKA